MTRAHWLLAGLVAVYLLLAGLYAAVVPIFEGFDAQAHYAAIQYFREERTLPELTPQAVERSYELIPHPPLYYVLAALAGAPWPLEQAAAAAQASANAYFDKSLALRQSVTLPTVAWQDLAPAWSARGMSLLGGLIVLLCTWWTARRLCPTAPAFALAAAAIAAFNPQFLFTAVTITNDGWSAATAALALAAGIDVVVRQRRPQAWFWVGAAAGLAALTKYSTLAVVLPLGVLWVLYWREGRARQQRSSRQALGALGWAAAGFALAGGWWFVRNWQLYGELVPLDRMAQVLPTMRRAEPYTWVRTLEHVPWLIASFWGVFVAIIAPPFYLDAARWFMLIGFAGLAFGAVAAAVQRQRARTPPSLADRVLYLVLLPWLAAVAAMVLYWTRTVEYGEQGRLGHVGASAFGILMAAGWGAWLPAAWKPGLYKWRQALYGGLTGAAVITALALAAFLQEQYALPPAVQQGPSWTPDRTLDATFAGGMRLLGADFPAGAALEPGKPLTVTLYFTTDAPIAEDYTLFLHAADAQDRLLYQFDGVPVQGRHPTRQWTPKQVFADTHQIVVDAIGADGLATLSIGFYPIADPATRVPVLGAGGQPLGDRLVLGQLRLHSFRTHGEAAGEQAAETWETPVGVWQNGISLRAAHLARDGAGRPVGVTLTWKPAATIQDDYTVFVQVLDSADNILAQIDTQPQNGQYPTSTWRAGDVITDTLAWTGNVRGWQRVILGLYGPDGTRVPLAGGGDFLAIGD